MDHTLRCISFVADIGDVLVVMVRRGPVINASDVDSPTPVMVARQKVCCHVFQTDDVCTLCPKKSLHHLL